MLDVVWLASAGVLAGIAGVVVSMSAVVSYPALLLAGLSPLAANVTNTLALVFNGVGAAAGSRIELAGQRSRVVRLAVLNAVGGALGAALLLLGSPEVFEAIVPWLVCGASLAMLLRPRLLNLWNLAHSDTVLLPIAVFAVATYGGYFGAASGVLMLTVLTMLHDQPLARTVAVKNVLCAVSNGTAAIAFSIFAPVSWATAVPLSVGFLVGGRLGPAIVRRLPAERLRVGTALCGLGIAGKLALDAYT